MKADNVPIAIDAEPVERLVDDFLAAIRRHYKRRTMSPTTVLEVLNAVASVAALIVSQTDARGSDFFVEAFNAQMVDERETEH